MLRTLVRSAFLLAAGATSLHAGDGSAGSRWGASYFPNVPLTTHDGRSVHFFDDLVKDKVVVINFIYTSCADACPLETAKLAEVQEVLGDRLGKDVFFCSISIDPERDTPEVLAEYAARFGARPGWTFATGKNEDIREVRRKLGMIGRDESELSEHTLSLLLGNQATGQWMKRSPYESPQLLAMQLGTWLHNWKAAPESGRDYAKAPALRTITKGETLFRTRCSACHVLGVDDGITRQGPPLFGVMERRERAWLARWIAEPDVMLREKDPLAMELFQAGRGVAMPNLRLRPDEVEAILDYMTAEDARLVELAERLAPRTVHVASCCEKEALEMVADGPTHAEHPAPAPALATPAAPAPARGPSVPTAGAGLLACALALLGLGFLAAVTGRS